MIVIISLNKLKNCTMFYIKVVYFIKENNDTECFSPLFSLLEYFSWFAHLFVQKHQTKILKREMYTIVCL